MREQKDRYEIFLKVCETGSFSKAAEALNYTQSGISLTVKVRSAKKASQLCSEAKSIGLQFVPLSEVTDQSTSALIFYYNQVPLERIDELIEKLALMF